MTDWSRIITAAPVNRDAALVASGRGEASRERVSRDSRTSRTPLPTKPVPVNPELTDLAGQKFGRLTVFGMLDKDAVGSKAAKGVWVVKCTCGLYETRTTKALLNPHPDARFCCNACENKRRMLEGRDVSTLKLLPHD